MQTTRVQLPDGRLVTILGGDAESTAALLRNHYLATNTATEEPLEMPSLGEALTNSQTRQAVTNDSEEEALPLPTHIFSR
jgi:hypothetical protein